VKTALYPDELQAVRAPGGTRTPTTGSVIRRDLRFTTGAWYPRQEMSLRPPTSRAGALPLSYAGMVVKTVLLRL
jgi:hypothetical protein